MSEDKRRFKTIIAGRPYTILANKPTDHLKLVSELTNEKIMQIKTVMPNLDIEQRSVLVSINAISDAVSKQIEINELKEEIKRLKEERGRGRAYVKKEVRSNTLPSEKSQNVPPKMTYRKPTAQHRLMTKKTPSNGMPYASKEKLLNRMGKWEDR
ncbi:Cell division protein ZapA [Jeotgalibaca dankookensis]|uniref:Cell division protein ZapA n=1 Tax=Jeotgalibaca dankookensis TaxID=708126 RepID=A0A1S6IP42_9LACT|nr:cell division protein ZapA [Jeotgalibaca dankookensis]AQS53335.1 Cell division protein ZapA [Jeotgalibaca dankookensis]